MNSTTHNKLKLLYIIDSNYGSMGEALYFLKGYGYDASLLLQKEMYDLNVGRLDYPLYVYQGLYDIKETIAAVKPDIVFLNSGYLYVPEKSLTAGDFFGLVNSIKSQKIVLVTSDPFLNIWDLYAARGLLNNPKIKFFKQIFDDMPHLTLFELKNHRDFRAVSFYNNNIRLKPAELSAYKHKAHKFLNIKPTSDFWLFFFSAIDYEIQLRRCPSFHAVLLDRLNETIKNNRVPVLIAPSECIEVLKNHLKAGEGQAFFLTYCDFESFNGLLLGAEYVFGWNIISFSVFIRIMNELPIFFFDKGHLHHSIRGFYRHIVRYFSNCRINIFRLENELTLKKLRLFSREQNRRLFNPIYNDIRRQEPPQQALEKLLNG
jgi:hypothetical protein